MAKQIKYTDQFRQEAVEIYQNGNASAAQVARKLGIHANTMCRWVALYGKGTVASLKVASCQAVLQGKPCADQKINFNFSHALEYIQAIKIQVSALEQFLVRQTDRDDTGE